MQRVEPWAEHTRHLFAVLLSDRDATRSRLQQRGVASGVHYPIPVHRQPAMAQVKHLVVGDLGITDYLASTCLSLPIYPELAEEDMRRVLDLLLLRQRLSVEERWGFVAPPVWRRDETCYRLS